MHIISYVIRLHGFKSTLSVFSRLLLLWQAHHVMVLRVCARMLAHLNFKSAYQFSRNFVCKLSSVKGLHGRNFSFLQLVV